MRIKDIALFDPPLSRSFIGGNVSFIPMESLRYDSLDKREIPFDEAKGKYTPFENGDLLFAKVTPCFENGNVAIAADLEGGLGFGSSEIFVLRAGKKVTNRFLFYLVQCSPFRDIACASMCGVGGLKRIAPLSVENFQWEFPSLAQQRSLCSYLDSKLSVLDSKIAILEKKLDAYKRLKTSIINQAVTRGLDSNVKHRNSGVRFLGDIPIDWKVGFIKDIFSVYSGATPDSKDESLWDGEINWVTPADYKTSDHYVGQGGRGITQKGLESCATNMVPAGSLIFSKRAPVGTVAISTKPLCTNQGCMSCVPHACVSVDFYYYLFSSLARRFEVESSGTTFVELSAAKFCNYLIQIPPYAEQKKIAYFLDEEARKIDLKATLLSKEISLYKELKSSLINEVITGKRKVA